MAEKTVQNYVQMEPTGKETLGRVELAPEVLEVIAGIATTEIEGVAGTRGNFATGVVEKLGKKIHGKGIKTEMTEDGLFVDVYCFVKYGYSVPKVAMEIQTQIRQAVLNMTSLEAKEVNVHITGIHFEKETAE
ncbi:Asp23/Gls24 family envelope stress response protein [Chungangia koreensis]|uniref:Asp23/Gls24 family envelope stress response protein n=1 Tax=Chungangia koreensis TaxID=752657 RepID=A0ABV8X797_9LACT